MIRIYCCFFSFRTKLKKKQSGMAGNTTHNIGVFVMNKSVHQLFMPFTYLGGNNFIYQTTIRVINGAFHIKLYSGMAFIVASDGMGWEHVSVSFKDHTPRWGDMCHVKDLFWHEEDCVVQYHPPKSLYKNLHEHCLHLWRPVGGELPIPSPEMVAP